jgi:hypothetical protein
MLSMTDQYKKIYCCQDYKNCARNYLFTYLEKRNFEIDEESETVVAMFSNGLWPHELEWVKEELPDPDLG